MKLLFNRQGDFAAAGDAGDFLRTHRFSVAPLQGNQPRGIAYGADEIGKWRTLNAADRVELDGVMTGDQRNGPVTVEIHDTVAITIITAALMRLPELIKEG